MNVNKVFIIRLIYLSMLFSDSLIADTGPDESHHSKRIEVYTISQHYWDVKPGDTLSEILKQLVALNKQMRNSLATHIIQLNPDAFINGNQNRLRSGVRLWLPDNLLSIPSIENINRYEIKTFSWGQVYTIKR